MTQENKELLLKDLCARVTCGVKVLCISDSNHKWYNLKLVDIEENDVYLEAYEPYTNRYEEIENVKPYLFPMSSMTDGQKTEWDYIDYYADHHEAVDWLNKNHFDYRGLIDMGLALDATNKNIY